MDRHIWHCWPDEASPTYELTLLSEIIRGLSPVVIVALYGCSDKTYLHW